MAESLTISFCEHNSSPARYVALRGGGKGGGVGGEKHDQFSAEPPDNEEIRTLLVYIVFQHLLILCICRQKQNVTINTNSWSSLSPTPSPTTLVAFPDYTPNNLQVGPRGRGYQRYKQWKTGQRLGMRPKTEQRLGMRPKTEHELGMRPKEQYPGYKEKPFLLIWMIPFYFHVVVESVHEKQLILLSDILC